MMQLATKWLYELCHFQYFFPFTLLGMVFCAPLLAKFFGPLSNDKKINPFLICQSHNNCFGPQQHLYSSLVVKLDMSKVFPVISLQP